MDWGVEVGEVEVSGEWIRVSVVEEDGWKERGPGEAAALTLPGGPTKRGR